MMLPALPEQAGVYGVYFLIAAVLVAMIKGWAPLRKINLDGDATLRADLLSHISVLREQFKELETRCGKERADAAEAMRLERVDAAQAMRLLQRRCSNAEMSFNALLILAESAPEKLAEGVIHIKAMRDRHAVEIEGLRI